MGFEEDFFEVENDVGDIFNDAVHRGKLVHGSVDLDGADGRAFQGGKQHAPQRVSNRVSVAGFKRLGDKFRVSLRRGCVLSGQPFGHFKTS